MSAVFLTGGSGLVGRAVLQRLMLEPGQRRVVALARDRTRGGLVAALGAEPVMGDVLEPDSLLAGMKGCDVVYHIAGVNAMCLRDPAPLFRTNVLGSVNVVRAAARAGVRRIVYTSSAAALGEVKGTIGSESSPHRGFFLSNYERSKYEAELAVMAEGERTGLEVVAVNPSSVQGPGRTTGSARLFLDYLNGGRKVMVDTVLSIVDIDDCAEGHVAAERHGAAGERYVLNGSSLPLRKALRLLDEITGLRSRPLLVPAMLARAAGAIAQMSRRDTPICREMVRTLLHGHRYDGSRAARDLGIDYSPIVYTLRRTVEWYVELGFVRRRLPALEDG